MPNTSSSAFQKLKDTKRRRRFIANQIKNGFAFQVRALRKAREMSQQDLAREAETTQALISRVERDGATNLSVKTLQKIADAFDVALVVRFEPIDRLLRWVDNLGPDAMAPRKSSTVLVEMERTTSESRAVATPVFRVISTNTADTTAIQRTLAFESLALVDQKDRTTSADELAVTAATGAQSIAQRRVSNG